MKRILVTGGSGYIGSHTITDLLDRGYEVLSIDNFSRSDPSMLEGVRKISGKPVLNIEVDLADREAMHRISGNLNGIDGVIHFAAFKTVPESMREPELYYRNNLMSLLNVLELCERKNIRSFVFSSSCSVYGNSSELPVTEETPLEPTESPYAETKVIGERIIRDFCRAHESIHAVLLRYFNPVGAHPSGRIGETPLKVPDNLVPYITQTAAGIREQLTVFGDDYPTRDGSCVRDFIHVMDIARAHTLALDRLFGASDLPSAEVFNLGTGNGVTVLEAVRTFEKVNGLTLNYRIGPRRDGDVVSVYADNTKAWEVLGWTPRYTLEDMMRTAWIWQQHLSDPSAE